MSVSGGGTVACAYRCAAYWWAVSPPRALRVRAPSTGPTRAPAVAALRAAGARGGGGALPGTARGGQRGENPPAAAAPARTWPRGSGRGQRWPRAPDRCGACTARRARAARPPTARRARSECAVRGPRGTGGRGVTQDQKGAGFQGDTGDTKSSWSYWRSKWCGILGVHTRSRGSWGHARPEGCVIVGMRDLRVLWGHGIHKGQNILGYSSSRGLESREIEGMRLREIQGDLGSQDT